MINLQFFICSICLIIFMISKCHISSSTILVICNEKQHQKHKLLKFASLFKRVFPKFGKYLTEIWLVKMGILIFLIIDFVSCLCLKILKVLKNIWCLLRAILDETIDNFYVHLFLFIISFLWNNKFFIKKIKINYIF
jgi:hypothetical protein